VPVAPVPTAYTLEDIRPVSLRDTTQVVIMVSGPVQPLVQHLSQPDRLAIDLPDTQLPLQWNQYDIPFSDSRLQTIHVGQSQANRVQLILALQAAQDYRVTVQSAPDRVMVELLGTATTIPPDATTAQQGPLHINATKLSPRAARSPRAQLTPLIFIDPGHGGHDPGAVGPTGLEEKTVVLQVARELRQLIQQEMPQYRVLFTRDQDVFIPLTERARMANEQQAQVFISIHANSSPRREASGIETWYLSFAASARAKRIAARENMMSEAQLSILELILRDMHETDRINQSAVLAQSVQSALSEHMAAHYPGVIPRGVEGAPFAVLHRTTMPSVLVETAFISNPQEEAQLRTTQYQRALARGMLRGLRQFLQTTVVAMH
jgi:N-acetylmuramoyl-L-alanine amidase